MEITADGRFSPDAYVSIGELAQILARMADVDLSGHGKPNFSDVKESNPYAVAIAWADESGIITGTGNGAFLPEQKVSRQELAAMLYRYMDKIANSHFFRYELPKAFKDDKNIAGFAKEPILCLQQAGILVGDGDGNVRPQSNVTRAECAKIIATLMKQIIDGKTVFLAKYNY